VSRFLFFIFFCFFSFVFVFVFFFSILLLSEMIDPNPLLGLMSSSDTYSLSWLLSADCAPVQPCSRVQCTDLLPDAPNQTEPLKKLRRREIIVIIIHHQGFNIFC
jgi:hypothetical protein